MSASPLSHLARMEARMAARMAEAYLGLGQTANQAAGVSHAEQMRTQQAVYTLRQAAEYRKDAELMAAVRALIRKERDDLGALIDEI
jgi:hypothetical protein